MGWGGEQWGAHQRRLAQWLLQRERHLASARSVIAAVLAAAAATNLCRGGAWLVELHGHAACARLAKSIRAATCGAAVVQACRAAGTGAGVAPWAALPDCSSLTSLTCMPNLFDRTPELLGCMHVDGTASIFAEVRLERRLTRCLPLKARSKTVRALISNCRGHKLSYKFSQRCLRQMQRNGHTEQLVCGCGCRGRRRQRRRRQCTHSPVAVNPRWRLLLTMADSPGRCLPPRRLWALARQPGRARCRRRPPGLPDRVLAEPHYH